MPDRLKRVRGVVLGRDFFWFPILHNNLPYHLNHLTLHQMYVYEPINCHEFVSVQIVSLVQVPDHLLAYLLWVKLQLLVLAAQFQDYGGVEMSEFEIIFTVKVPYSVILDHQLSWQCLAYILLDLPDESHRVLHCNI